MFGSSTTAATTTAPAVSLRVQTSLAGKPLALGWGRARVSGNLIWYGDFRSQTTSSGSGGGKGGGGGGGKGSSGGGSYTYSASVMIGLCEGPVFGVEQVWNNSTAVSMASLSLSLFGGDYAAVPWPYMSSVHNDQALPYRGLAYAAAASMPLGSSANLPNLTFEIDFNIGRDAIAGQPDADPAAVIRDFLTSPYYGTGFPAAFLGDLSSYSNFCVAYGLLVSPVIVDQAEARAFLKTLLQATNSEAVWSGGFLTIVPYADSNLTANGRSFTLPNGPLYSLSDVDFKAPQGTNSNSAASGSSSDPVQCTRLRPSDQNNQVSVEYLDRGNSYNATIVDAQDDAGISLYGLRKASVANLHCFCLQTAAIQSAHFMLQREAVRNTYAFTLGPEYILLDPMDIVSINDDALGLSDHWVRITEISENTDGTLSMQAEDALYGGGVPPVYAAQPALGIGLALTGTPGGVTMPVIWEPTYALAGGTEIWLAVAGTSNFGGADIWVSTDNATYQHAGVFEGLSRMGTTTSALPAIVVPSNGAAIDPVHTLGVDMRESGAQLLSGTQADALAANTLCYLDGEYFAYQTATLTAGSTYTLSYLVRGLFDSTPSATPEGSQLVRLNPGTYFRYPITVDRIGSRLWFKILPFNDFGAGAPAIDEVAAYPHTVTGVALAEVLQPPANLTTSYIGQYAYLTWTEVQDFRTPVYEIRKGASWLTSQRLGSVAHPPFLVFGDDTYWVAAVVNPAPGLVVYSAPVDLSIQGAAIVSNILNTWDEGLTGWTGTMAGGCVVAGGIVTTSDLGAGQVGGTYEIPTLHEIDVGRVCAAAVLIDWTSVGYPAGQNVLSSTDWLAITDLLGASVAGNASVYPEISIDSGSGWQAWQRFVPGSYLGRKFRARMQIQTLDPGTTAALLGFRFYVAPPERDDHYLALSVPTGGMTLTFSVDGGSATPFNGGPGGAVLPAVQGTIVAAQAGDTLVINSLSASGCTVRVVNGSAGVLRTVNLLVQGY